MELSVNRQAWSDSDIIGLHILGQDVAVGNDEEVLSSVCNSGPAVFLVDDAIPERDFS
jgi:hypothetical protein